MSASAFFISAAPGILREEDEERLGQMFDRITRGNGNLEPLDWMDKKVPEAFLGDGQVRSYNWAIAVHFSEKETSALENNEEKR
jgi:hypothetical protein